jgi:hypothetical protein
MLGKLLVRVRNELREGNTPSIEIKEPLTATKVPPTTTTYVLPPTTT